MPQSASSAPQQQTLPRSSQSGKGNGSIYVGKELDREQLLSSIARRTPEKEFEAQVKTIGEYSLDSDEIIAKGLAIVGSSGSGRSTTLRRVLDGFGQTTEKESSFPALFVIDQKGEHRGLAWKYKWQVLAFAADSQAQEFRVPVAASKEDSFSSLVGYLLQEWCLESGLGCSDQHAERIASIVRSLQRTAESTPTSLDSIVDALIREPELAQFGQKISKNLIGKGNALRIFSPDQTSLRLEEGRRSYLFDISGRGLRDPTTKEERQLISVLILRELLKRGVGDSIIVLEDVLDRFKSQGLRRVVSGMISELRERKNTFVITSRTQVRGIVGADVIEILHRLSGEKAVTEEIAGFKSDITSKTIASIVGFLPRGYAITSTTPRKNFSSALRVEPLQFGA